MDWYFVFFHILVKCVVYRTEMYIVNTKTRTGTFDRGNYSVKILTKGKEDPRKKPLFQLIS